MRKSFALFLIVPFTLFGENLSQLLELSKNNKMIDSSKKSVESIKDSYESEKMGYLPSITVDASYQETNKETNSVPDNMSTVSGTLDYVIYDGGKKYDVYDSYEANIKQGDQNVEALKNEISLTVIDYYFNFLSYKAQKESKLQEIEQLEAQVARLKKYLDAGTTTEDEVQKIISNLETAKVELQEIELNIQTVIHNLEYVVGKSVSIEAGSEVKDYDVNNKKLRPDIKALEYEMDSLLSTAKSKKSDYLPTLSFRDQYAFSDFDYESSNYTSTDYDQNIASLNLTWKIFDFGATSKSYQAAYKQYLSLKSEYEYEKNKASVDLKLALKSYEIGKLKIKSAKAGLVAANSAYESIKAKYQNGLVDNVSYLESLSEKYDAESALKVALYDLEMRKANIIYYSGENLEEFVK